MGWVHGMAGLVASVSGPSGVAPVAGSDAEGSCLSDPSVRHVCALQGLESLTPRRAAHSPRLPLRVRPLQGSARAAGTNLPLTPRIPRNCSPVMGQASAPEPGLRVRLFFDLRGGGVSSILKHRAVGARSSRVAPYSSQGWPGVAKAAPGFGVRA
jgi:hypothetical protein